MSERPWMPLYIGDYLKDTGHLSVEEHGAYLLLIMRYWEDGGLPADERLIARYSRMAPDQWAMSRDVLAALFDDGWKHKRIDEEIAKAEAIIEKRRAAAEHRHSKSNAHAEQVQSNSSDTGVPQSPITEPSSLRSDGSAPAKPTPRQHLNAVLDAEHADAVIEHRQRLRKALTPRAAKLLAADLAKFPDPNAAADRMIAKGWASIDVTWGTANQQAPPQKPRSVQDAIRDLDARLETANANAPTEIQGNPAAAFRLSAPQFGGR